MMKLRCRAERSERTLLLFGRPFASLRVTVLCVVIVINSTFVVQEQCSAETNDAPRGVTRPTTDRIILGHPTHPYPLVPNTVGRSDTLTGLVRELHENSATIWMRLADGEALWGLGERFDSLNMRGRTMETWI